MKNHKTPEEECGRKENDELWEIVERTDYWLPYMVEAAKAELQRRDAPLTRPSMPRNHWAMKYATGGLSAAIVVNLMMTVGSFTSSGPSPGFISYIVVAGVFVAGGYGLGILRDMSSRIEESSRSKGLRASAPQEGTRDSSPDETTAK